MSPLAGWIETTFFCATMLLCGWCVWKVMKER